MTFSQRISLSHQYTKVALGLVLYFCALPTLLWSKPKYQAPYQVHKIEGEVQLTSPFRESRLLKKGDILTEGEKLFTSGNASIHLRHSTDHQIEIGKDSIVQIENLNPKEGPTSLLLIQGRLRSRLGAGSLQVQTPTAKVLIGIGYSDVIISNYNTLIAPRQGDRIKVEGKKAIEWVQVSQYALVTVDGDVLISDNSSKK